MVQCIIGVNRVGHYYEESIDATATLFDGQSFTLPHTELNTYIEKTVDLPMNYSNWIVKVTTGESPTLPGEYDNFYFKVRIKNVNGDVVWESGEIFAVDNDTYAYLPPDFDFRLLCDPPEHITYNEQPDAITSKKDGNWWGWALKLDYRNKKINFTDTNIPANASMEVYKDGNLIKQLNTDASSGVGLNVDGGFVLDASFTATSSHDDYTTIDMIDLGWAIYNAEPGNYKVIVKLNIDNNYLGYNTYECTWNFTVYPEVAVYNTNTTINGELNITPNCICYLNTDDSLKTVTFDYMANATVNSNTPSFVENNTEYRLQLIDENDNILKDEVLTIGPNTTTYTFNLSENTKKEYTWRFVALFNGTEYILDEKEIIVMRREYCHSLQIEVKMFDLGGNEINKIPHPTSADYDASLHSQIKVQITIKDEQGRFVDIPIDTIQTNWQYTLTQDNVGQFSFIISNSDTSALGLGNYGIAVYVNKDWCNTNGYLNSYIIEATDVYINSNKIEKVMFVGTGVDHYENGITYLGATYEMLSGIFINSQKEFEIVQQLETRQPTNQYQFCYTPFIVSQTLNIPTYTEDEMKELARAIMRELAYPRKKETFAILDKELPKLNQSITLNINGKLKTITIQSLSISIANKELNINISNEEQKLLKDYLSMLK